MEPRSLPELKRLLSEVLRDTDEAPLVRNADRIVEDLGLDSIQMINFLLGVEDCLNVQFDFESLDVSQLGTVLDFACFIDRLGPVRGPV